MCPTQQGFAGTPHRSHLTSPWEMAWSTREEGLPAQGLSASDKVPHLLGWQRTARGLSSTPAPAYFLPWNGRKGTHIAQSRQWAWGTAGPLFKHQLTQPGCPSSGHCQAHWTGEKAPHKTSLNTTETASLVAQQGHPARRYQARSPTQAPPNAKAQALPRACHRLSVPNIGNWPWGADAAQWFSRSGPPSWQCQHQPLEMQVPRLLPVLPRQKM